MSLEIFLASEKYYFTFIGLYFLTIIILILCTVFVKFSFTITNSSQMNDFLNEMFSVMVFQKSGATMCMFGIISNIDKNVVFNDKNFLQIDGTVQVHIDLGSILILPLKVLVKKHQCTIPQVMVRGDLGMISHPKEDITFF